MRALMKAAVLAAAAAGLTAPVAAQDYPSGDIRYILHVKPGGATDVMARRLADGLQKALGVNVVVENRDGGSGARQMAQLARAKPDGQTIGSVTASHLGMFLQSNTFDADSVTWACNMVLDPYLLAVRPDSGIDSLADLVKKAKAAPGELSVAGFGEASGGQVAWQMFADSAKLGDGDINWVPYSSVGDAVVATLGGHNDIAIAYTDLVQQHVKAGTLKVIGVMSTERLPKFPDAQTYAEAGYPVDTTWQQFRGIVMPAETPAEIQDALCGTVQEVMQTPEMVKYIEDSDLVPGFMGHEEFTEFVHAQDEAAKTWTAKLGIASN
ncbi:tripartite tricarboxylate transporter substrate binding protein [Paracoccus onubensis]|uniref:Bug family tripartite tricarboxylate transporter substrate binding protein n=1 Tax=Paracoccus onubensis TaxID=1675788 RepID=UPI0027304E57|nr:tripartite tricarboxylate transporter substrate binding protein [Paracoccus onubensis]MDP0926188.1 tripartite tricarboxylate transporter substrate binding protein [Paracoccus onubensis]